MANAPMLTSKEACRFLGVKAQTLYAYVSRGLLRVERRSGKDGNLYARDELESLRARSQARAGHGPTAAAAMRYGEPILESAISCIHNDMLYYRGQSLGALIANSVPFENVTELLWSGELPPQDIRWTLDAKESRTRSRPFAEPISTNHGLFQRLIGVAIRGAEKTGELLDETLRRARHLILESCTDVLGTPPRLWARQSVASALASGLGFCGNAAAQEAINAALVASADHELNASTFAARIAAGTGADLYACLAAGIGAFSGRRHGLSPFDVLQFVEGLRTDSAAVQKMAVYLRAGRALPGFGHRLYRQSDPRAMPLIERAQALAATGPSATRRQLQVIAAMVTRAQALRLPPANLDLGLVAVAQALGLPSSGASTLFALGRIAGWTAHILEQRQQGILLRPRARYIGREPMN